jgi:outer membrane autotransporter protein
VGYASFDSEIDDKSSKLESSGVTLTGYGSFYVTDNFYVDARISYGKPDFDQQRKINLSIGNTNIQRTSVGSTTANQYTVAMGIGYHFNKKSWNITPNGSFRYMRTNIDGFTESGGGAFDFIFNEQEIESLVWSAGVSVSKAISLKNGVITPQFDFNYNYESENKGGFIEARFIQAPIEEIFIIETDSPDSTYGSAGLGIVYITSNGRQAYINYRSVIGLDGFSSGSINLGARFEF